MKRLIVLCLCAVALFFTGCPTQDKSVEIPESKTPAVSAEHIEKDADGNTLWTLRIASHTDTFDNIILNQLYYEPWLRYGEDVVPEFYITKIIDGKGSIFFELGVPLFGYKLRSAEKTDNIILKFADNDYLPLNGIELRRSGPDDKGIYKLTIGGRINKSLVDKLRKRTEKMSIRIRLTDMLFDIDVPPLFFEWLKRI